jgi:hypothetical protein
MNTFSKTYCKFSLIKALFLFAFFLPNFLFAQVSVDANLDKQKVFIGQTAKLNLRANITEGTKFQFPILKDTITSKIEIRSISKIDTVRNTQGKEITLRQSIEIASFDTGYFAIPPIEFLDKSSNKKYATQALLFGVSVVPVDTTLAIKDIRGPIAAKIPWWDYVKSYWWILLIIVALIAFYFYNKSQKNKPKIETPKEKEIIPAHVLALAALNKLKEEAIWKNGAFKEFHSILSEILREYLEKRYGLYAMELTTEEIIISLKTVSIDSDSKAKLKQVLFLSDMVKFAKEIPIAAENEQSINNAILFVDNTKEFVEPIKPNTDKI